MPDMGIQPDTMIHIISHCKFNIQIPRTTFCQKPVSPGKPYRFARYVALWLRLLSIIRQPGYFAGNLMATLDVRFD